MVVKDDVYIGGGFLWHILLLCRNVSHKAGQVRNEYCVIMPISIRAISDPLVYVEHQHYTNDKDGSVVLHSINIARLLSEIIQINIY